ncbi:DNA-directed RNA polymerase III subunit RPC9-like [Branchiostoma floridae]|uniref:DNA-directed RNA polymerase III subunit RPC9 n=2 Tax=Branchiostoma floridae TaxID=7739 RepID=A0A9J7LZW4_BRAFL|nr:DNA-directed RNA polymerase III subunit RPC9-like [Branchiostoma floridae]
MEVVNDQAAMLSNYEVFSLLKEIESKGKKKKSRAQQNLATITYETLKYLSNTPCTLQNPEMVAEFMEALGPYNLTKAEKLQLLNHRPSSAVEIQLIIEESEERLTEEQIDELLQLVADKLPDPNAPEGGGEEEDGGEGGTERMEEEEE